MTPCCCSATPRARRRGRLRRIGGVRFEDLLLVTDEGCETLTGFSYSLTPSP
jgi:hypothetical protein